MLLWGMMLSGCASAWSVVTPTPKLELPATRPTEPLSELPTVDPAQHLPAATPTWQLAPLVVANKAVQSWTDPNDVTGLLYQSPYLWAVTSGGVVRWDTRSGEHVLYGAQDGLVSQAARGIAQDGDGHIWVGYADHEAWSEYDGQSWRTYATREGAVEARYVALLQARRSDPYLWSSRAESGWLWLTTLDGRVKAYDGSRWRIYGEQERITRHTNLVVAAVNGRVWAVGQGISTAEEGERNWDDHSLFAGVPEGSRVSALAVDGQGSAWLAFVGPAHLGGGLCQLDVATSRWVGYLRDLNEALPRQVYGVTFDAEGVLWLCGEGGLAFKRSGTPWQRIAIEGVTVQCYDRDPEGRFWIGTARGVWSVAADGVDLRGPWQVAAPLVGNQVAGVALDGEGKLWVGTSKGLTRGLPSGQVAVWTTEEVITLASTPQDGVWVSTPSALYQVNDRGMGEQLYDGAVSIISFSPEGAGWIYTEDGWLRAREGSGWRQVVQLSAYGVIPRDMAIGQDGVVWLATASGLGKWSPDGQWSLISDKESLPDPDVRAVALGPEGELWIATARGLARRLPSGRTTRLTGDSTEGGLRSAEIWNLVMDGTGTLWVMTGAGISARTREADWSFIDLAGVRQISLEPTGALWVGALGGLYRIERQAMTRIP